MKHFLLFLRKESTDFRRSIILAIVGAGVINGIGVSVAVKAVGSIKPGQLAVGSFIMFAACIVGYWMSKELVLNRTTVILEQIIERLRLRILYKIKDADLLHYEAMDKGRIYSSLSSDAVSISSTAGMVLNASSSLVMLVFTFILIAAISLNALIITVGLIGIVIVYYMKRSAFVNEQFTCAAIKENEFFDNLNGFLNGFKELKLNRAKRDDYFKEEVDKVLNQTRKHREDAGIALNHSLLIAHTYLFFTLAGLIYVLPVLFPSEADAIPKLVPIILFAAGPLADVVSALPALAKAEASILNIYQLEADIDKRVQETPAGEEAGPSTVQAPAFASLSCENLSFQYPSTGRHPFRIQATGMEIKAGQIVFLVGGNGSGKSTLLKLLTGLYRPAGGKIQVNGETIDDENIGNLRELFSPIFTDFYLFKRVLAYKPTDEKRVTELLQGMELSDKTSIVDGKVSNLNLSTGQRKRLALVLSTLDDRPFYIFDEWAADQDPVFRKYFYEVLLRQMAKEGKTILAATHDDHYFHVADKVYAMEYGQLVDYKALIHSN